MMRHSAKQTYKSLLRSQKRMKLETIRKPKSRNEQTIEKQLKIIIAAYNQIIWQVDNVFEVSLIGEHLNTDNHLPLPSPFPRGKNNLRYRTTNKSEPQHLRQPTLNVPIIFRTFTSHVSPTRYCLAQCVQRSKFEFSFFFATIHFHFLDKNHGSTGAEHARSSCVSTRACAFS